MSPRRLFAYRLARAVGRVDVDAMLGELPERAFAEWGRYYQAEPWGEDRADLRAAITSFVAYHAAPGKRPRRQVEDFMAVRQDTRQRRMDAFHAALMATGRARRVKE